MPLVVAEDNFPTKRVAIRLEDLIASIALRSRRPYQEVAKIAVEEGKYANGGTHYYVFTNWASDNGWFKRQMDLLFSEMNIEGAYIIG